MTLELLKRSDKGSALNADEFDDNLVAIEDEVNGKVAATEKGAVDGVATLDDEGLVPVAQINDKALLAATAREVGGTAYPNLLGIACPPSLEFKAHDFIDEANGAPSIASFARASTATYFDAAGVMQTAAADELRHDFDPVTGEYKGWLIEESRTNLFLDSNNFSTTAWAKGNTTVDPNVAPGPDKTQSLARLTAAASGFASVRQTKTITAGSAVVGSFYCRADTTPTPSVYLGSSALTDAASAMFDLSAGTVGTINLSGTASQAQAGIIDCGDGLYRVWLSCKVNDTSTSARCDLYVPIGQSVYGGYAQLEAGTSASSYIPTTSAQVTRAADVMNAASGGFAYNPNEGTFLIDFSGIDSNGKQETILSMTDGTNLSTRFDFLRSASGQIAAQAVVTGAAQASISLGGATYGRLAFAFTENDFAASLSGSAAVTGGATGSLPTGLTTVHVGHRLGTFQINGHIGGVRYFPRRLTNEQLQLLTG